MSHSISIVIPSPYVTIEKFSEETGMPVNTVKSYVAKGLLPIKKKAQSSTANASRAKILINKAALTIEALQGHDLQLKGQ